MRVLRHLKIMLVAALCAFPIPQTIIGQDSEAPQITGVCPDGILAGLLQTVIVDGNFPPGTTFTVDGVAPISMTLLSNSHAALKVKLTKGTHKVAAKANGFESGPGDIIVIDPGDVLLVPLPDLAACGTDLVTVLRETNNITKQNVADSLKEQYTHVENKILSGDLSRAKGHLTRNIKNLIDAQTGKSITTIATDVLSQFNDLLSIAISAAKCLLTDPPKAEVTITPKQEAANTVTITTKVEKDKGTVELPVGVAQLEKKTVELNRKLTCCTKCADIFVYTGHSDAGIKINTSGVLKCGPFMVQTCLKKDPKEDKDCASCKIIAIQVVVKEEIVVTPQAGDAQSKTTGEKIIDNDPKTLRSAFPTFFSKDESIKPLGVEGNLAGDADCLLFDFPGLLFNQQNITDALNSADTDIETTFRVKGSEAKFTTKGIKSIKLKQEFKTFWLCDRSAEKKPPCVLGAIRWGQTTEITFDVPNKGMKCAASDVIGPECETDPADEDFKKCLQVFRAAIDDYIAKVKETPNFKEKSDAQQKRILDKFEELKKAEGCGK